MRIAEWYRRHIGRLVEAALQPGYGNGWAASTTSVILPPRSAPRVARSLLHLGIETRSWWGEGCHVQPAFAACPRGPLPATENLGGRVLGLPHFPDMEERDVERVAKAVSETCRAIGGMELIQLAQALDFPGHGLPTGADAAVRFAPAPR
jgi:dTDP-4-amino-4,6-dideoxygalactose transaminase